MARSSGYNPELLQHNKAISKCGVFSDWQQAINLLNKLGTKLSQDVISYNAAIAVCQHGEWAQAA